jgi:hypothetical protein
MLSVLLTLLLGSIPQSQATDWVPLFNGKNYEGFTFWIPGGPEETFLVKDGCLAITGRKAGFAYTRKKYRNYELSYQWRYDRPADLTDDTSFPGNGGVLLHITVPLLKEWPRSIEVDGKQTDAGKLIVHEKKRGEIHLECTDDPSARKAALKPVGEWNTTLLRCENGQITVTLNGKPVATGKTSNHPEGAIGFMSQGSPMYYRDIKVHELP